MRTRDLAQPMGLLLGAVSAMKAYYGVGRPINLLRGSKGKDMASWMEVPSLRLPLPNANYSLIKRLSTIGAC